jgi:hypothetical protein
VRASGVRARGVRARGVRARGVLKGRVCASRVKGACACETCDHGVHVEVKMMMTQDDDSMTMHL